MNQEELMQYLAGEGYKVLRVLPSGVVVGISLQLFTVALCVGLTRGGVERRYCYENGLDAAIAAATWDGQGDPPGLWLKEKPSERLGPGLTEPCN